MNERGSSVRIRESMTQNCKMKCDIDSERRVVKDRPSDKDGRSAGIFLNHVNKPIPIASSRTIPLPKFSQLFLPIRAGKLERRSSLDSSAHSATVLKRTGSEQAKFSQDPILENASNAKEAWICPVCSHGNLNVKTNVCSLCGTGRGHGNSRAPPLSESSTPIAHRRSAPPNQLQKLGNASFTTAHANEFVKVDQQHDANNRFVAMNPFDVFVPEHGGMNPTPAGSGRRHSLPILTMGQTSTITNRHQEDLPVGTANRKRDTDAPSTLDHISTHSASTVLRSTTNRPPSKEVSVNHPQVSFPRASSGLSQQNVVTIPRNSSQSGLIELGGLYSTPPSSVVESEISFPSTAASAARPSADSKPVDGVGTGLQRNSNKARAGSFMKALFGFLALASVASATGSMIHLEAIENF